MFRIYEIIIELLRLLASVFVKVAQHDADLARQARRAAASIALNCGEAAGGRGGNRRQRLLTALGSAREVEAACDVAEALGYATLEAQTRAMLNHLIGALVVLTR
jgi:four helix bundle protein